MQILEKKHLVDLNLSFLVALNLLAKTNHYKVLLILIFQQNLNKGNKNPLVFLLINLHQKYLISLH
jgi:hypothetical protein